MTPRVETIRGHKPTRLERAVARYKETLRARDARAVAKLLLKEGRLDEAFQWLRRTAARHPGCRRLERLLQRVRTLKAKRALEEAQAIAETSPSGPAWAQVADLLRIAGRRRKAHRVARRAIRTFPDCWELELVLGKLEFDRLARKGSRRAGERALRHLQRALELEPCSHHALFLFAIAAIRLGKASEAVRAAEELVELLPGDARARALLVEAQSAQARSETAAGAERDAVVEESVLEAVMALPGAVGAFLFDGEGRVTDSLVRESSLFEFSLPVEALEAMAAACRLDTRRIGLGELVSCDAAGDGWLFVYRGGTPPLMAFFEGAENREVIDSELERLTGSSAPGTGGPSTTEVSPAREPIGAGQGGTQCAEF